MNWLKLICSILIVGLGFLAKAQELTPKATIPTNAELLRVDNFGKLYLVGLNEISLLDPAGKFIVRNSNKLYGDISDLDASNGLELLLFFKDLSQIIFLDNQLAEKGKELSLEEIGFDQVTLACTSHGLGVWLFDQTRFELTRIDQNGKFTSKSGNLMQVLGFAPQPNFMRENNNWVYLNDPKRGILVFDNFGAYYKTIPIFGVDYFQIKENRIFHSKDQYYISFDTKELKSDTLFKFEEKNNGVFITKNQINILNNKELNLFEHKR